MGWVGKQPKTKTTSEHAVRQAAMAGAVRRCRHGRKARRAVKREVGLEFGLSGFQIGQVSEPGIADLGV